MENTLDEIVETGMRGETYDFSQHNELTYSAWLIGRRLSHKPAPKQHTIPSSGCDPGISLHPSNWR